MDLVEVRLMPEMHFVRRCWVWFTAVACPRYGERPAWRRSTSSSKQSLLSASGFTTRLCSGSGGGQRRFKTVKQKAVEKARCTEHCRL